MMISPKKVSKWAFVTILALLGYQNTEAQFNFESTWRNGDTGTNVGDAGFGFIDLDGDGLDEVVTSGVMHRSFWQILKCDTSTMALEQTYVSNQINDRIPKLATFRDTTDGKPYLLLGLSEWFGSGFLSIKLIDLESNLTVGSLSLTSFSMHQWHVVDVDQDGKEDLYIVTDEGFHFFNLPSLTPKVFYPLTPFPGSKITFGNFDDDSDLEFYGSAGVLYDFENNQYVATWNTNPNQTLVGIKNIVAVNNNSDSNDEIIILYRSIFSPYDSIAAYNYETKSVIWRKLVAYNQPAFAYMAYDYFTDADVNADGLEEIIFGNAQHIFIASSLNAYTIDHLDTLFVNGNGTCEFKVCDLDNNNVPELIWADGFNQSGTIESRIFLQELNGSTRGSISDTYWAYNSPNRTLLAGDFDQDGNMELMRFAQRTRVALEASGPMKYDNGSMTLLDAQTKETLRFSQFNSEEDPWAFIWGTTVDYCAFQADDDPQLEIVASEGDFLGFIDALTFEDTIFYQTSTVNCGNFLKAIEVADINLDGTQEILVTASTVAASGFGCSYLYIFDKLGHLLWESEHLGSGFDYFVNNDNLKVGNVDDDPSLEIIVHSKDAFTDVINIFDGTTLELDTIMGYAGTCIELADADGDGTMEIFLGSLGGYFCLDYTGQLLNTVLYGTDWLKNLVAYDFDDDQVDELVVTYGNQLAILSQEGAILWEKDVHAPVNRNKLEVGNIQGVHKLWVTTPFYWEEFSMSGQSATETPQTNTNPNIRLYPNPANQVVTVDPMHQLSGPGYLVVYDLLGRSRIQMEVADWSNPILLSTAELSDGTYFLQAGDRKKTFSSCLIIQEGR